MDYLLYPNSMSREQLIKILTYRGLKIPNIEQLETAELVKIYSKYALPLSCRNIKKSSHESDGASPSTSSDSSRRPDDKPNYRVQKICLKRDASAMETNCPEGHSKQIKLNVSHSKDALKSSEEKFLHKRHVPMDEDCSNIDESIDQCQKKFKRQQITWP